MITPKVTVELSGIFFQANPIGRFHRNVYSVLREEAELGVVATRERLRARQRTTTPPLQLGPNIVAQPTRRRGGRSRVVVSATYGPQPLVRFYNRFIDSGRRSAGGNMRRGYRIYAHGARTVQAHIDANTSRIERRLTEGLT